MTGLRLQAGTFGRALLATALVALIVVMPAIPVTSAGAASGWTSNACAPSGTTCSFPADLGSQVGLTSISCPTTNHCVAVGNFLDTESPGALTCPVSNSPEGPVQYATCSQPLIETLSNGKWTASVPPLPGNYNQTGAYKGSAFMTGGLSAVSCPTTTTCVAIGSYTPVISENGFDRFAFAEVLSGGSWTAVGPFPYPECLKAEKGAFCDGPGGTTVTMNAISCISATSCVAVGQDKVTANKSSTGNGGNLAVSYSLTGSPTVRTNWKASDDLTALDYTVTVSGVSCTSTAVCVAVGSTTTQTESGTTVIYQTRPLAVALSGSTWTDISPGNPSVANSASLDAVSCSAATTCQAVGSFTGTTSSGPRTQALAESLSGTTWTPDNSLETMAGGATGSVLQSVFCTAATACTAAGNYTDGSHQEHALIQTLSGAGWQATTGLDPANDSSPAFSGISCPEAGVCEAVGNAETATDGLAPFVAGENSPVATSLEVTVPGQVTSGRPFTVTVRAQACVNQVCTTATGYRGTVAFTSTDSAASLPSPSQLTNGGGTFSVVLDTVGKPPTSATITTTDTVDSSITGTSKTIKINAAPSTPSSPQFLHATSGATGATLTWYPPASTGLARLSRYVILRGTSPGTESSVPVASTPKGTTTYVDVPSVAGVKYYYVVEAVNSQGDSPPSNEASAIVSGSLPGGRRFASTPDGGGHWMTSTNGVVFAFGKAGYYGSPASNLLNQSIVSMASTPDGRGYWIAGAEGAVFSYGDAHFYGSLGSAQLAQPIVGMAATRDGGGYWLVGASGTVYTFGDARYFGSASDVSPDHPIVGMVATPNGDGYWLVDDAGAVFTFGAAPSYGSTTQTQLVEPIVGMATTPDARGYWLVGNDGAMFAFGDAHSYGGLADQLIMWPIAGALANPDGQGYQIVDWVGNTTQFGS